MAPGKGAPCVPKPGRPGFTESPCGASTDPAAQVAARASVARGGHADCELDHKVREEAPQAPGEGVGRDPCARFAAKPSPARFAGTLSRGGRGLFVLCYASAAVMNNHTRSPPCDTGADGGAKGRPVACASDASFVTRPTRQPEKRVRSVWPSA